MSAYSLTRIAAAGSAAVEEHDTVRTRARSLDYCRSTVVVFSTHTPLSFFESEWNGAAMHALGHAPLYS